MQNIRKAVFETNSSSSHSLTMGAGDLVEAPFPREILRQGFVELSAGEFGWEWFRYYTPLNKLTYLFTQITDGQVPGSIDALCEVSAEAAMLREVVKEYSGCDLRLLKSEGYIDHQSARGDGATGLKLFRDKDTLKAFVFGASSCIQTGNDNSGPDKYIQTDRGKEDFFAAHYARVPADAYPLALAVESHWSQEWTNKAGQVLPTLFPDWWEAVKKEGVVTVLKYVSKGTLDYYRHQRGGFTGMAFGDLSEAGFRFTESLKASYQHMPQQGLERPYQLTTEIRLMVPKPLAEEGARLGVRL